MFFHPNSFSVISISLKIARKLGKIGRTVPIKAEAHYKNNPSQRVAENNNSKYWDMRW